MNNFAFLEKIHPLERLKILSSYDFVGDNQNHAVTPLSASSKLICKKGCIIQPYVTIEGIVYCEENVFIGPYSFLRGPLYLGQNVRVGPYCEITRSIVMKDSSITHKNIIPDSVIEERVWVAGGAIFCNTRMDLNPIKFDWMGFNLEAEKFSAYIEPDAKIGVCTILMPGTHISAGKTIFGPTTVKGKI